MAKSPPRPTSQTLLLLIASSWFLASLATTVALTVEPVLAVDHGASAPTASPMPLWPMEARVVVTLDERAARIEIVQFFLNPLPDRSSSDEKGGHRPRPAQRVQPTGPFTRLVEQQLSHIDTDHPGCAFAQRRISADMPALFPGCRLVAKSIYRVDLEGRRQPFSLSELEVPEQDDHFRLFLATDIPAAPADQRHVVTESAP